MGKKRKISSSDSNNGPETDYFVEINDIIKTCSKEVFGNKPKIAEIQDKSTECRPKVQTPELLGQDVVVIAKKEPEIVVFKSRKHKIVKRNEKSREKEDILGLDNSQKMNSKEILEKLKFDVGSFGMKGFSKEEQRKQEKQRAVKLGAKPERREYVNYKVLMEKRELEKTEESLPKKKKGKSKEDTKIKAGSFWSESNEVERGYKPKMGKFKNGVLTLSSRDIKTVRHKR